MTIDHDAISDQVRASPYAELVNGAAYLDLYDEVKRLRDNLHHVLAERDATFALMLARAEKAEAERDALWAALEEIADGLKGIARDIQIGPDDEGREIYDMVQAMQWDARQALKGQTND